MATAAEILERINVLVDAYSDILAPSGGSKLLKLNRAAGSDAALSVLQEGGTERWRYGMLANDSDFVLQWSTDGSELNFVDRLRIDGATGAVAIAGLALDGVDINSGTIDGTAIGANNASTGAFTSLSMSGDLVYSDVDWRIYASTVDGADTARLALLAGGGFSTSRGAYAYLCGNEHATTPGEAVLAAGNVVGAATKISAPGYVSILAPTEVARFVDGKLGLNTSSPTSTLHIRGGATYVIRLDSPNGSNGYILKSNVSNANDYGFMIEDVAGTDLYQVVSGASGYHRFAINGVDAMRVDSAGVDITGSLVVDGSDYKLDFVDTRLRVQSGLGGSILKLVDAGAADRNGANPYLELGWSSSVDGAYERLCYVGKGSGSNPDAYFTADHGNIRLSPASGMKIITTRVLEALDTITAPTVLIGTTVVGASKLRIIDLPTSSAGLSTGDIWNDGGTLKVAV